MAAVIPHRKISSITVNPGAAVISAGKNNDYRHPHAQTMQKLEARGIPVYRTDENGTILAVSDGKSIHFNKDPGSYTWPQEEKTDADRAEDDGDGDVSDQSDLPIVYITESGDKYHLGTCRFLDESKLAINKEEAVEKGLQTLPFVQTVGSEVYVCSYRPI